MGENKEQKPVKLLTKKKLLLEEILNTTKDIGESVKNKKSADILKLLNLRQQKIDELDAIDKDLSGIFGDIQKAKKYFDSEKLEDLRKQIDDILCNIKKYDDENRKAAMSFKQEISKKIKNIKQTSSAMKGYGIVNKDANFGAFIDTKK